MVNYRRSLEKGGTFFFTVNLRNRNSSLLTSYICALRDAFKRCKNKMPFEMDAIVILPDHLHTVWTLPEADSNYSARWKMTKSEFTKSVREQGVISCADDRGEHGIWQRRFWEHQIRDISDFDNHVEYIHYNPVKHGTVDSVKDWPYSSFHRYVKQGMVDLEWCSVGRANDVMCFGEAV